MTIGAEAVIKSLEKEGVDLIFGYPGGAVLGLYDALNRCKIRHILTRNEQAAAHAASGYARTTGKVGVCMATSGPGATNLVTGIATAYMDSIPLVAITGQVPTHLIGRDVFQEVDITGATAPFTKHNYLVKDARELPRIIKEAFHIASTGRPGPVLIDVPKDIASQEIDFHYPESVELRGYKPNYDGHPLQISRALEAIKHAERPVICAGGGVVSAKAHKELLELAEKNDIPVVTTLMGIGSIPGDHPLALGMLGMHGTYYANKAVSESDLLISMGARFGDRAIGKPAGFAPKAKVIHIDIDPAEIGKNIQAHVPIVGDVRRIVKELIKGVEERRRCEWLDLIKRRKEEHPLAYDDSDKIKPQYVIQELSRITRGNCIITTEVGQHQMWTALYYCFNKPGSFITSGGLGTMGYGFPAAIGAQMGNPKELVITISGDGSFQMNLPELATAVENKLPIKIIILNNQSLGLVRQLQEFYCGKRYSQVNFQISPDFVKIAEGYGVKGLRVEKKCDVTKALEQAVAAERAFVLDIIIDCEENVYPMVLNGSPISEMIGG
ncbi:MAG: biosynthetic-type acetolactate synthase large subunit [Firmicutes bacterium]|nr:biosynthetic-type acetolactate synthase large subunit [Bacillota bacterium]